MSIILFNKLLKLTNEARLIEKGTKLDWISINFSICSGVHSGEHQKKKLVNVLIFIMMNARTH